MDINPLVDQIIRAEGLPFIFGVKTPAGENNPLSVLGLLYNDKKNFTFIDPAQDLFGIASRIFNEHCRADNASFLTIDQAMGLVADNQYHLFAHSIERVDAYASSYGASLHVRVAGGGKLELPVPQRSKESFREQASSELSWLRRTWRKVDEHARNLAQKHNAGNAFSTLQKMAEQLPDTIFVQGTEHAVCVPKSSISDVSWTLEFLALQIGGGETVDIRFSELRDVQAAYVRVQGQIDQECKPG